MSEGPPLIYYRIDSSRFSFKEYFWGSKNPLTLLIALIIKTLRIDMGGSIDDPAVDSLHPFEITEANLPPEMLDAKFQILDATLTSLGFEGPIFHLIDDKLNFTTIYWATYRHKSGEGLARIHCRIWRKTHPPKFHLFPVFVTMFQDGTALYSSPGKPDTELPREIKTLRLQGKPAEELWQIHQLEVQKSGKPCRWLRDGASLREAAEAYHVMARDFHLRRGAFRAFGKNEQQQAAILEQVRAQATATGAANAETLAELELLQKAPPNRANGIWILIITALAFVLAGGIQDSFLNALLLIPILLFHELGHYLAMYVFKYRNLQMFFIPFLGAAVTGHKYNVPGWKKVVVFLMGPLPGIVLGAALAGAGIARDNKSLVEAAMLCIFINGFNLLPLLPFDGGRVVGTILFSRHYLLDTVFRAMAALGIVILGFALNATFLTCVGFVSLFAVGASFKVAKVTEAVRDLKLPSLAEDGESIPPQTADVIITELKKKFPKGLNKQIAQHTLTVFETLNAKPPGWVASVFFLGLHLFAFLAAFIGVGVIELYQHGDLNGRRFAFGPRPTLAIASALIETAPRDVAPNTARSNVVAIVATYKKRAAAKQAYDGLMARLPVNGQGALFGNTVYLRIPATNMAARLALFEECNKGTTNTFVERTNYGASFSFQFDAPMPVQDAEWFKAFNEYWELNGSYKLIPPWCPDRLTEGAQRADYMLARHTMHLLTRSDESPTKMDKQDKTDQDAIAQALRIGDGEKVERIRKAMQSRAEDERKRRVENVKKLGDAQVHRVVANVYMDYPSDTNALPAYRASRTNIAGLLGTLKGAKSDATRYAAEGGYLLKNKNTISVHGVEFNDFIRGGPEFIRWLENHGVQKIRYHVSGTYTSLLDESDTEE